MASNTSLPSLFSNSSQWISQYNLGSSSYCNPATFANVDFPNVKILDFTANAQGNYTFLPGPFAAPPYNEPIPDLNFCNVTITYEHPGWNDSIVTNIFLPTEWNGRYMGNGGAGYLTGGSGLLAFGIMENLKNGFACATTDGGHISDMMALSGPTSPWALTGPGYVNWPLFIDFAYVSLHDMNVFSKAVIAEFYKQPAKYSYWSGGSQGGRQGHLMAQKYPEDFDGILALLPAINWIEFAHSIAWPLFIMDSIGEYPAPCELDAITKAAIEACDALDGVEDGLISRPGLCTFEAKTVIGKTVDCDGGPLKISEAAATVAQATWDGPRSSTGEFQWYGYLRGADISAPFLPASTTCKVDNSTGIRTCEAASNALAQAWYNSWVLKDNSGTIRNITHEKFDELLHQSRQEYKSAIDTSDPDLSGWKKRGGKMITWHGTYPLPSSPYQSPQTTHPPLPPTKKVPSTNHPSPSRPLRRPHPDKRDSRILRPRSRARLRGARLLPLLPRARHRA